MMARWWLGAALIFVGSLSSNGPATAQAPLSNADAALSQLAKELADQSLSLPQRLEIARVFGAWATGQVRGPLLEALKDPAPEMRLAAARALGWAGNREAVPALRARAEMAGENAIIRGAAIHSLGIIGDPSTRSLIVAAAQDPDAVVRQGALWSVSLGPFAEPADRASYLIRLIEDQELDGLLRCDGIRAIVDVKEDRVVEALKRVLEREPRMSIALPGGQLTQPQIMELRRVQARDVAAWAAGALGEMRAKSALPLLLAAAEDPIDFFLRQMALTSLVMLAGPEPRPVYVRRLEDALPENRTLAIMGLLQLADKTAVPAMLPRLKDHDPQVRAQVVTALATLGDASVRPALEELQKIESESGVLTALEDALSRLPR